MLHLINTISDKFFNHLKEDPVRPNISIESRIGNNRDVFVLCEDDHPKAITCVSYQDQIPQTEDELFKGIEPQIAVFYSIWSYQSGSGRQLIFDSVNHIRQSKPNIKRFVTLSPKTELAKKFHLKNGAIIYKDNPLTINYEYLTWK